jgi:CRISPR system Cascade subunit CasC
MNIELHILQNFAPSCLNRDDTNAPKTCEFGGVTRARISSQCFKRAIRLHMAKALAVPVGERTKRLATTDVKDGILSLPYRLATRGRDLDEAQQRSLNALAPAFGLDKKQPDLTGVGLYLSDEEIQAIADAIDQDWDLLAETQAAEDGKGKGTKGTKKAARVQALHVQHALQAIGQQTKAADIALYGRMMAENANMNIDAACQVAHALSTHEIEMQMDFWTAVDDLQPKEDTGALGMGHQEFNSACFYRYALVNTGQLLYNLGDDKELARRAVLAFVRAALEAIPNAKQNSHAAQNRPSYVQVVVGAELPASLANAFERPVRPRHDESLVAKSIEDLTSYQAALRQAYSLSAPGQSYVLHVGHQGGDAELLAWIEAQLEGAL